jgi:hypothetical protein
MTLSDLLQRMNIKLGEQSTFYPEEEKVASGINPAQRLLCLAMPLLLQKRALLTIQPDQIFTDLRTITPTIRTINRVVLGDVTTSHSDPVAWTGELTRLLPTTLQRLGGMADWMEQTGPTRKYWLHGPYWFGLFKRPMITLYVTIIYEAMPPVLSVHELSAVPDIPQAYHPLIADIATGLLLQKEGDIEGKRGLALIMGALEGLKL